MSDRIYNFDYLRFFAATCIVMHHFQQVFAVSYENGLNFYGGTIPFEYIVELFFMLSGFLCVKGSENDGVWFNMRKKVVRLYPYAFLSILFYALEFFSYNIVTGTHLMGKTFSFGNIFSSFLLVHHGWFYEYTTALNNPTWYLCILLLVYLIYYSLNRIINCYFNGSIFIKLCIFGTVAIIGLVGGRLEWDAPFLHMSNSRGYAAFFIVNVKSYARVFKNAA